MRIITDISEWITLRKTLIGKQTGFVPTMGHLHAGHASLYSRAKQENDLTIASIFVNPTQFNSSEDFALYPQTLADDCTLLSSLQVDYLLLPNDKAIYADKYQVQVIETELSTELEGAYRPAHFNGVLTVVLKLLNLIQPQQAYFGEKDFQQLLLVKKMAAALFIPTAIIACETIRAADGLALSSRNSRLSSQQRQIAPHFPQLLHSKETPEIIAKKLIALGFKVDYIAEKWQRRLGAVWLDNIRLIDNVPLLK